MKEKNIFFEKILDSVSNWHFHCNKSACARKSRFHDNEIFIKPCFFNFFRVFKFREAFKINFRFFFCVCRSNLYYFLGIFQNSSLNLPHHQQFLPFFDGSSGHRQFLPFLMVLQNIDNFYHFLMVPISFLEFLMKLTKLHLFRKRAKTRKR